MAFSIQHAHEGPFRYDGLRKYFEYRDLGIYQATEGKAVMHVIRAREGTVPGSRCDRGRLRGLVVPQERLAGLAAGLGSDVPFFLSGGTALGISRGEVVYPLPDLPPCNILVIYPGVRILATCSQPLNVAGEKCYSA